MKRILLMLTGFLLAFPISGQLPDFKAGIKFYEKVRNLKDYQDPLSKGERLDSVLSQTWDNTIPGWINSTKEISTYTTGSQVDITYKWDKITLPNKWKSYWKTEYSFDGSGNITSEIAYEWDNPMMPDNWYGLSKTVNTYVNGNNTLSISYIYMLITWMESGKTESSFHPNGKTKEEIQYIYLSNQWTNDNKKDYYYDLTWKDTLEVNYHWDMPGNKWELYDKTRYGFNAGGKVILATTYEWDSSLPVPAWVLSGKVENTYDISGNLTSMSAYAWDKQSSQWVGLMKIETGYNGNDPISVIMYHWDKTVNPTTGWVYFSKTEQTGSGTLPENVKFVEMTGYLWDVNKWITKDKDFYYYSDQSTDIFNDTYEKSVNAYPNPAREYIIFDLNDISESAKVEIYDISGRKISNHNIFENSHISVRNLSKGLYIYMLHIKGITYKGKFLKE